jgi:L-asparaginase II
MANPILVEVSRDPQGGRFVESLHRGAMVVARPDGEVIFEAGDIDALMCPRSAFKALQALPMLESGAREDFDLNQKEIALSCSSHSGQRGHTEAVLAWLEKIGCGIGDLECGPHLPLHEATAHDMLAHEEEPSGIHNNCSGKHTGFLTLARQMDVATKGYTDPDHPVQQRIAQVISEFVGMDVSTRLVGPDGCHAPNYQMPLRALAKGMARLAVPGEFAEPRRPAIEALLAAARAEPLYIAGEGRACTLVTPHLRGGGFIKSGAEGVYTAVLPGSGQDSGIGIALKIDDGGGRASAVAMANLLDRLGLLEDGEGLAEVLKAPVRNTRGQSVGFVSISPHWETFDIRNL